MAFAFALTATLWLAMDASAAERFNERYGPPSEEITSEEADVDFAVLIDRVRRAGANRPELRRGEFGYSNSQISDSVLALAAARRDAEIDALVWDLAAALRLRGDRTLAIDLFQFLVSHSPDFRAEARLALATLETDNAAVRGLLDLALIEFAMRPARPGEPGREVNAIRIAQAQARSARLLEKLDRLEAWPHSLSGPICGMNDPQPSDRGCASFDVGQSNLPGLRPSSRLSGARWDAAMLWAASWAFETVADACTEEGARRFVTFLAIAEAFLDRDAAEVAAAVYGVGRDDEATEAALTAAENFLRLLPDGPAELTRLEDDHPLVGRHFRVSPFDARRRSK